MSGAWPYGACVFMVTEDDAAAIRAARDRGGERAAIAELRRRFIGLEDNENTRNCARTIADWTPLPPEVRPVRKRARGD